MSKPKQKTVMPKLRFPEFRDAGPWEVKRLGQLGKLIGGLTYSPDDVRNDGLLVLRSSNIQHGQVVLDDCVYVDAAVKGANLSQPNDILICVRNGSRELIGKNAIIPDNLPLCTHGAFMTVFRAENPRFVHQIFQTSYFNDQVSADLGATINSINSRNLIRYRFPIPKDPKEQQKIADCLSSLDDLLRAEEAQLAALKDHKKGLMQRLFPAEGETTPRLRFPEFRDAGPWEVKRLGDVYRFKPTNSWSRDQLNYESGTVKNIHYGDIHKGLSGTFRIGDELVPYVNDALVASVKDDAFCEEGDIVFADASEDVDDIGKAIEIIDTSGQRLVSGLHTILVGQIDSKIVVGFGAYLFASSGVRKQIQQRAQGAKVLGISKTQLAEVKLAYPPEAIEQQKIADCLSSLDDLIRAKAARIEVLKAHKKGLMQRLFPRELP